MGWSRPDEESCADYDRDSRKHEPWLGDEPPLSCQAKPSTALETVYLIRMVDTDLAVELLEAYAAAERERVRLDAVAAGAHP